VTLGKEVEGQIKLINESDAADKSGQVKKLYESFELFLKRITDRPGNTFATLNWIAETFFALASGAELRGQPTPESRKYFDLATKAYQRIIDQMKSDDFGPRENRPQHLIRLQVNIAKCAQRSGDFDKAVKTLQGILKDNPLMLEAQLELSYAYMAWGQKDAARYKVAILGDGSKREDPKTKRTSPLHWGWAHMAVMLQKPMGESPSLKRYFHEARYNLALCRYRQAMAAGTDATTKKDLLEKAENDILLIARLYPDLGEGAGEWEPEQYRKLFATIRREGGKKGGDLQQVVADLQRAADAAATKALGVNTSTPVKPSVPAPK
jgi:tetratricopeptide (TPR) repeat protein